MEKRECTRCHLMLPLSSFHKRKQSLDGISPRCAKCTVKYMLDRHQERDPNAIKRCSICKAEKSTLLFHQSNRSRDGCQHRCIECSKALDRKRRSCLSPFLRRMVVSARTRANKTGKACDITFEEIRELWNHQNGRCALSGTKMTHDPTPDLRSAQRRNNVSIDRIDSSKGYVSGNVHLVTSQINLMKLDYSVEEFVDACTAVHEWRR